MGVTILPMGLSIWVCKGPIQMALLCHTVNGLTSSDLGSRPSRSKHRKRQTQPAASVWPDLQHVKLQCQHEVFEPLRLKKRSAHKVKSKLPALVASCTQLCMLGIPWTTQVHLIAYTA